ncbi:hypothetical protein B0T14DRAFT_427822 [Immersiella caudata]|uniref:Calcium-transporting ATPase n=1 Tax=Immersiella caudata TaxID=314043 RepID=A0AA39WW52_9PEZI|nr:hypothetical protein B0T14DRAFT_427822 [Immersiella caudata]
MLDTDCKKGLNLDEPYAERVASRRPTPRLLDIEANGSRARQRIREETFGTNALPNPNVESFLTLAFASLQDLTVIGLAACATLEILQGKLQRDTSNYVEGYMILTTVVAVVLLTATVEWLKGKEFSDLAKRKDDRMVQAIRSGRRLEIPFDKVLVGDVLCLEPGDVAPADGILISKEGCQTIMCDDSSFTGESIQASKDEGDEVYDQLLSQVDDASNRVDKASSRLESDPFIFSSSQIMDGVGTYLVTGVGVNSLYGRIRMSVRQPRDKTPLEKSLDNLAEQIAKWASVLAIGLFFLTMGGLRIMGKGADSLSSTALGALAQSITLLVVAIPEGLPLAVRLALAFSTWRMKRDGLLVRRIHDCEVMSNATTICTDKTGTLTMNEMQVVAGIIGSDRFDGRSENPVSSFSHTPILGFPAVGLGVSDQRLDTSLVETRTHDFNAITSKMKTLIVDSVALNSRVTKQRKDGKVIFRGCQTEAALLRFAGQLDKMSLRRVNKSCIVETFHFNPRDKFMATITRMSDGSYRLWVKGAPEVVLKKCTRTVVRCTERNKESTCKLMPDQLSRVTRAVDEFASDALRTLAVAYRDLPQCSELLRGAEPCYKRLDALSQSLTLIGVFGIQDPLRPGVEEAISSFRRAGVTVRMVTGDSLRTAEAIARECGILMPGDIVMEAQEFERSSDSVKERLLPRLRVLARSTPDDKERLVLKLKALGETVAVTGDGTNDGPALKAAHVGFSMGSGTEVAKEASSIVLLDDHFPSIVRAILYARRAHDAIRQFLRFQLSVNASAIALTTLRSAIPETNLPGLGITTVQWLWVNAIMDSLAASAYATDNADPSVLDRKPESEKTLLSSLVSSATKMIIGQAALMVTVTMGVSVFGRQIIQHTRESDNLQIEDDETALAVKTLVFNTFIWLVFFNMINNRCLDNKLNPFEGLRRSPYFLSLLAIIAAVQAMFVQFGGENLDVTALNRSEWAICISLGFWSIPAGILIRLVSEGASSTGAEISEIVDGRVVFVRHQFRRKILVRRERVVQAALVDERTPLLDERRSHAG